MYLHNPFNKTRFFYDSEKNTGNIDKMCDIRVETHKKERFTTKIIFQAASKLILFVQQNEKRVR